MTPTAMRSPAFPEGWLPSSGFRVHDDTASDYGAQTPGQRHVVHDEQQGGIAVRVRLKIAEVPGMAHFLIGKGVLVTKGIVMVSRALSVLRGQVSVLMDMNSVLRIRRQARYGCLDFHFAFARGFERHDSGRLISFGW